MKQAKKEEKVWGNITEINLVLKADGVKTQRELRLWGRIVVTTNRQGDTGPGSFRSPRAKTCAGLYGQIWDSEEELHCKVPQRQELLWSHCVSPGPLLTLCLPSRCSWISELSVCRAPMGWDFDQILRWNGPCHNKSVLGRVI